MGNNKSKDETGFSWQNHDEYGNTYQENSKTYEGEHTFYNHQTGIQGYHGPNMTEEDRKNAAELERLRHEKEYGW